MDERIPQVAAKYGHLDCLKYAHQNGSAHSEQSEDVPSSSWDERVPQVAVEKGQLECLKYLHQNGCARPTGEQGEDVPSSPWDEGTTYYASKRNHRDCMVYAYINGCPINEKSQLRTERIINENRKRYQLLLKETIQKDYNICNDIINEIVKYLD